MTHPNAPVLKLTTINRRSHSTKSRGVEVLLEPRRDTSFRRVALLIDTAGGYGRGLIHGIAEYNRERGRWSIYCRTDIGKEAPADALAAWSGDGIIFRTAWGASAVELYARCGVPVVDLRSASSSTRLPQVVVDEPQIAELAAQHLLERGVRHFAFCGPVDARHQPAITQLAEAFARAVANAGFEPHRYQPSLNHKRRVSWELEQQRLADWVHSLPKPVGILACDDERGLQVLDAARRCGAVVPDEVAVVGIGNDEPLCDLADPPLTSIDLNAEGVGYEAAALLDRLMNGAPRPSGAARTVKVTPRGIVARRSSDLAASEDEEVSRAISYIRQHACRRLQVLDVLAYLGMSRASLQQRMKQIVGRTIHQEIQRVRMTRAKELLTTSGLPIKQVARESGFASVQYMTRVFRAITGETPAKYRSRRTRRQLSATVAADFDHTTSAADAAARA